MNFDRMDRIGARQSKGEPLIPKHGGYRHLKSFQLAELIYDLTVRFCECYIDKRSRTYDQMVQAARSGMQNIAEGSQASGTSKKTELKLTNVARASLEELRLDYKAFLRQRGLPELPPDHLVLERFKARRGATLDDITEWLRDERRRARTSTDRQTTAAADSSAPAGAGLCAPLSAPCLVANAALSLLNLCCHLLDRQLNALADAFVEEGGFTERLYRVRSARRKKGL